MNLLDSLLDAMVRLQGDALVMHVGEKPYVVTTSEAAGQFRGPLAWGQVELSSRVLTSEAMMRMLAQILPGDERAVLDEYGALEYDLTSAVNPGERFRIVAARGGDDIWLEIRRHPHPSSRADAEASPSPPAEVPSRPDVTGLSGGPHHQDQPRHHELTPEEPLAATVVESEVGADERERLTEVAVEGPPPEGAGAGPPAEAATAPSLQEEEKTLADHEFVPEHLLTPDPEWVEEVMTEGELGELLRASATMLSGDVEVLDTSSSGEAEVEISLDDALAAAMQPEAGRAEPTARPIAAVDTGERHDVERDAAKSGVPPEAVVPTSAPAAPETASPEPAPVGVSSRLSEEAARPAPEVEKEPEPDQRTRPALVVPLTRHPRPEPVGDAKGGLGTIERILRLAAARGAAALYVVAQSAPMMRVDGEFGVLDGEPAFGAPFVERVIAELAPEGAEDAGAAPAEWTIDVQEIGRVRCMTFRDHRGPGLIFRMVPQRAISADQLALPAEIQALCSEADGLVLVAGGRGSGKSTLLTSFVDLINRTRSDHVITAESQIDFVHENKRSFISQREVRGDAESLAAAVRAACREDPDVLIIEDLRTPELVTLALEAAQTGRLVFASIPAASALSAIERIIEMFPPERREKMQALMATTLRGVVSQVLLRKLRGGRAAAREVLLNTPAVANLILEGKTFQLPAAMESGRRLGMMSLAESLAALVREGMVHPSHAYRKAPNREQFLALLRRDGIDTSIAERLA